MFSDPFREEEGFGFFNIFGDTPIFIKIVFIIVILGIVTIITAGIVIGLRRYLSNNAAELLTRNTKVVDKRSKVSGGARESSASTYYYITFEFEDGSRVELPIRSDRFGMIVVGDRGELTYQGTRFKNFERRLSS
ncbi:DUF2500 domain-containing protein [Paenibacillus sp. N1-5-1-14]|uniref:DUF2500 domain-containing protein n=1 Tax=Paenibacillus radicibacter TaxID=2972488 RepID=UPI002158B765|nr:DUF2500 domain-containing protein [Paenibacillus radicibacter]MCR8644359.1 DUF2500 domain-containing protein [Paenibacillus radicibacter]